MACRPRWRPLCRSRSAGAALARTRLVWLAGLPVLFVLTTFLTLVISFQVFGVDLVD